MKALGRALSLMVFAFWALATPIRSAAADYPDRPIRLVVPFQAGGAGDVAARTLADGLSRKMGQPVVVDNKPGANGIIGTQLAAGAAPDGYTLFMGHTDAIVLNPLTHKKLPYDAARAFEPVAFVSRIPGVLVARPGAGIWSGEDLIRAAKARPGRLTLASWGIGSSVHLGMLMMEQTAGIELLHVPYQGTPAAVASVLAGQSDLVFVTARFALDAEKAGKAIVIGASSAKRVRAAPAVRTLAEQGFPGFDMDTWYGVMVPRGVSQAVRDKLHMAINALLIEPDTAEQLRRAGHEVTPMGIEQFGDLIARDQARWARLFNDRQLSIVLD